jgi:hypothetical protein
MHKRIESTNVLYKSVFEQNFNDEHESLRAMRNTLQGRYDDMRLAEQKRRQPRKRKHFDPLPEDVQQAMIDEVKSSDMWKQMEALEVQLEVEKCNRETLLNKTAERVEMIPDDAMHRLKVSMSYSYGSQGYGAMKYARGALEPYFDMLARHGFEVHIRQANYHRETGAFAVDHCDYELWANCALWMFDAAQRCLTLGDAIDSMKRRCVNPLVYNPFLPDWARL